MGQDQTGISPRPARREEDQSTHTLVVEVLRLHRELSTSLSAHIAAEPQVIKDAVDGAIDRLVPDGDAQGHKLYHEQVINAVRAKQLAAEAEEQFWVTLKRDAMKGGILGLLKVALTCFGLWLVYRIGYKGPLPW